MNKKTVQEQFGANAAAYVTSQPHAKGASLQRLVQLIETKPQWQVLDIATATGHIAFAFAPHVSHVWATDITSEMLVTAKEQAGRRGLNNITVEYADAENLPYEQKSFDLVTCRIAPHHFPDIKQFVSEAARVLRPNGLLAVVDNIVPDGPDGDYINAFEKLRDPSHECCLTLEEWLQIFESAKLTVLHHERLDKSMVFEKWSARHTPLMQNYLRALLTMAPGGAGEFLQPQETKDKTTFRLQEGIFIGLRSQP